MLKKVLSVALAIVLAAGIAALLLPAPAKADEPARMTSSDKMIKLIEEMEGFVAIPYWDYGQWTVGFGTRCPDEHLERYQKEGIPYEEAHELMREHVAIFEGYVNTFVERNGLQLSQHQFDALVSLVYNLGPAVLYDYESDLMHAILNGAGGNEFMFAIGQWCVAGGDFMLGLLRRRMIEAHMYLYGTYSSTLPSSFCYVRFDANGGVTDGRVQAYDTNLAAVPLSVPSREGYIFTGWYTEATGGQKVTSLDETTHTKTLYAHWEAGTQTPASPTEPESGVVVTVSANYVSLRQSAGSTAPVIAYLYQGEKVTITGLTLKNNTFWGYCDRGWICLEYTNYYEVTGVTLPGSQTTDQTIRVPVEATVISTTDLTVYGGPHTSYPTVGTLKNGDTVLIVEAVTFCNLLWGRYEGGWVRLNQKLVLQNDGMFAHSAIVNIKESYLNVRSGPGTQYGTVGQLNAGDQIEVVAVTMVDGMPWGRFSAGWVYLDTYTDFDISKMDYYTNHAMGQWYRVGTTPCDKAGQQRRDCEHCDYYELQATEPVEHVMGDWYVHMQASCEQNGQERRDCANCDHYETKTISKLGHDYGDWQIHTQPSCVQAGEERRTCNRCDHVESKAVAQLEHQMGQWYVSKETPCDQVGEERRDCENCDHYETRQTPAGSHEMGDWTQEKAPNCDTVGKECSQCANCGYTESRDIPATGHSFGQWYETVAPTEQADGERRRDCENCDHYETEVIPSIAHSFGDWYVHTEATCDKEGEERRNCTHCDSYESRPISKKEHVYGQWFISVAPTCSMQGQERRNCTGCSHFEIQQTPVAEHSLGQWYTSVEATCSAEGQERRDCEHCQHFELRQLPMLSHSFGDWIVHQAPSCTEAGQERRECRGCQHFESREVPALNHRFGNWYVLKFASCAEQGQERRDCMECGHFETRDIEKLAHNYGDWVVVTAPTIDAEGLRRKTCAVCGDQQEETVPLLPAKEQAYVKITASKVYVLADAAVTAAQAGELYAGVMAQLYEQKTVGNKVWGRIEFGWICITGNATIEMVREADVPDTGDKSFVNMVDSGLSIRPEPDTYDTRVGILRQGTRVRVYETIVISGNTWARTAYGWVWITDSVKLEIEPGLHTEHTYGSWYTIQAGTCVEHCLERRDCTGCDHYETREGWLGDHSFDEWFVTEEATCISAGERRRECSLCDYYETEKIELTGNHAFGPWQQTTAAGCESEGQERRECDFCTHSEIRAVPKLGHAYGDWEIITSATEDSEGLQRRFCGTCGHQQEEVIPALKVIRVYATITADMVDVLADCNTSAAQTGELYAGLVVLILEQKTVDGQNWGRIEFGWICLTGNATLEAVKEDPVPDVGDKTYIFLEGSGLSIRPQAGTYATRLGILRQGVRVRVYETTVIGGNTWARTAYGWVMITNNIKVEIEEGEHIEHTYGDWYVSTAGNCVTNAEERRDCTGCDHFETRQGQLGNHQYGDWEISKPATCEVTGEERQDCVLCGHVQTRVMDKLAHSFGDWQVVTAPTEDQDGLERRDCSMCGKHETRPVPAVPVNEYTYATITADKVDVLANCNVSAAQTGELYTGLVVLVLEQKTVDGKNWGRIEFGWICLTGNATLETVQEDPAPDDGEKTYIFLEGSGLSIRPQAGTYATRLGILRQGVRVRVYETTVVGGNTWVRTAYGWVLITNNIKVEVEEGEHIEHTYGDWYTSVNGTCVAHAEERRDCTKCDHFETRQGNLGDHKFGAWQVITEPTTEQEGLERRECTLCGHQEEQTIPVVSITENLYATITASTVNVLSNCNTRASVRAELDAGSVVKVLEQRTVSGKVWVRIELGWFILAGNATLQTLEEDPVPDEGEVMYIYLVASGLSLRPRAGTYASRVGALKQGTLVRVYEIVNADYKRWGRTAYGWVWITENIQELTSLDQHTSHFFGSWYNVQPGLQRRDCMGCDHYETREVDLNENPYLEFDTGVEDSWFNNVLFIGDSRFVGLQSFARNGKAEYFCDVGMTVFNYSSKILSDNNFTGMTLQQLLSNRQYDKIIFNFGLNEAGYATSYFIREYQKLLDMVQSLQPQAILILNGVMSVDENKAAQNSCFSPVNLIAISQEIRALCDDKKIFYIDCNEYFADANGYLYAILTSDGYHPNIYGYTKWRDWMAFAIEELGV